MAIPPDTKNWTWVLSRACPECGFDASSFPCRNVSQALRDNVAAWLPFMARPDVRARPSPTTWSTLEYGCHVRDVFRIFDGRLLRMLEEHDPLFENWDQDQTAVMEHYGEQDPAKVAGELEGAGSALADRFDQVEPDEWARTGSRSDGANFTIDSFSRYLLHDPVHHLHDVALGTGQASG